MSDVRSRTGIAVASDFASGDGTPIVVDRAAGKAYILKSDNTVGEIGAAGGLVVTGTPSTDDVVTWNGTDAEWLPVPAAPGSVLRSYLAGCNLSTAGSSSTFTVSAGQATNSSNTVLMELSSSISKTTGAWAVGTGNGGLDTGSISATGWYHVYVIRRSDTGVTDVCISLSATAPSVGGSAHIPAAYNQYRRIGAMRISSSNWDEFLQSGDWFIRKSSIIDVNGSIPGTSSRSIYSVSIPPSVPTVWLGTVVWRGTTAGNPAVFVSSAYENDVAPAFGAAPLFHTFNISSGVTSEPGAVRLILSNDGTIGVRAQNTGEIFVVTHGWVDTRGRSA